jgi:hypothetical protein
LPVCPIWAACGPVQSQIDPTLIAAPAGPLGVDVAGVDVVAAGVLLGAEEVVEELFFELPHAASSTTVAPTATTAAIVRPKWVTFISLSLRVFRHRLRA